MKVPVALGLGANLGTRDEIAGRFRHALEALGEAGAHGLRLADLRVASLYRTRALSKEGEPLDQPDYLNTAAVGELRAPAERDAARAARRLLRRIKDLEAAAGREVDPDDHHDEDEGDAAGDRPRPLDVDLLLLGDAELDLPRRTDLPHPLWPGSVQVPHPRLVERRFVLRPLAELCPERLVPGHSVSGDGRTVAQVLADREAEEGTAGVERLSEWGREI